MPRVTPTVRSFIVADQVFRKEDKKWCIIGIFDAILSSRFPVLHPSLGLYLELADGEGEFQMHVDFADGEHRPLARLEGRVVARDRLTRFGIGMQAHNLLIPAPGRYFLHVYFDDQRDPQDIPVDARLIGGSSDVGHG